MSTIKLIAGILAVVGALNWGLVAAAEFDLVAAVFGLDFGETNAATRLVYGLVGLSGAVLALTWAMAREHAPKPKPARAT